MDTLSPKERSARMSLIKNKDSSAELFVRRLVHGLGYRYRLHGSSLPGKPDLVFKGRRKVIFVHGCFWHRHKCSMGRLPKSKTEFWLPKLEQNRRRDLKNSRKLKKMSWSILTIWECQLRDVDLDKRIKKFLDE